MSGIQVRLKLPPEAARTAGPPEGVAAPLPEWANPRPTGVKTDAEAATDKSTRRGSPCLIAAYLRKWSPRSDSNRRPSDDEATGGESPSRLVKVAQVSKGAWQARASLRKPEHRPGHRPRQRTSPLRSRPPSTIRSRSDAYSQRAATTIGQWPRRVTLPAT